MTVEFLRKKTGATAIFSMCDDETYGILRALHDEGIRIPRDISVVGFDDYNMSTYVEPPLTTVRQPLVKMGRRGVELTLAAINSNTHETGREILPTEFIVRKSTAGANPAV
jgi:DNA-binding LacI/PurR family transcriptional regulator